MLPAINLGFIEISTYWLMLAAGTAGMLVCLWKRKERFSLNGLQCVVFTLLLTVVGFSGAKLLYILENIRDTIENGISLGGVSFFGSVFLIPLLMPLIGRGFRLKPSETMDICGPCVAIMIGCMRFGCFMQGCCGGWLARIGDFTFVWPTQAVESIGDFSILLWLLHREENPQYHGKLYPLFMICYSSMRFLIEFFRDTPKDWLYLSHGQWFSLLSIFTGIIWLRLTERKSENAGDECRRKITKWG